MPDPVLKVAMEEIKAVLKKHDIAGDIVLSSRSHLQFLREFKTSWSCAWIEPEGFLHFRCKASDFPSKHAQEDALNWTIGLLAGFSDALRNEADQLTKILKVVGERVHFEHMTREE